MTGGRIFVIAFALIWGLGCDDEPEAPERSEAEEEAEDRRLAELDAVDAIRDRDVRGMARYLDEFPEGEHAAEARTTLRQLVPQQVLAYRREAARLGADPLLVLAAADVFEAYADQAPAALRWETVSNHAPPPEGVPPQNSEAAALQFALGPGKITQYITHDEAALGLGPATNFLFKHGTELDDVIIGDSPIFRIERNVGPSDVMITAEGGSQYQSLTATYRVEVHVPAHDGHPARVTVRESSFTPTGFNAEFTQVGGRDSTNAAVRHAAVYDALLTQVGEVYTRGPGGRLAFYQRSQDYGAAFDLEIPQESRALDAVVTTLEGTIPGVEVGTRCRIQAGRGDREGPLGCRVGLVCAGQELYGHGTSGFVPCSGAPIIVNDEDPNDGDPAIRIDTTERTLTLRDAESGRFGALTLEARVLAIDEPTPQRPGPPAAEASE